MSPELKGITLLIPLLPLIGWALFGIWGKRLSRSYVGTVATALVFGSFVCGIVLLFAFQGLEHPVRMIYGNWIVGSAINIPFGLQVDQLSLLMVLTVSGVAGLIHLYSTGYMADDPDYSRYFSYLNLFTFFMLLLVLADNFVLMFVGWEGVGLCSYLLIGFWYKNKAPTQAGKKAFIVNRIGDAAFLVGLMLLAVSPLALEPNGIDRSLAYEDVFGNVLRLAEHDPQFLVGLLPLITAITLLLFIGATGKSAQIPLYVWLPDAMEGPTPVSALIHAATMVTAGVYMVARSHVLFLMSPETMAVIAIVGAVTALLAATIALTQTDIKRVLAYSTISQLGYMFIGCGVGAFFAAIFHLMTHAFFKACLFLGAGSVIIGTHHEQDMRRLGGLKRWMPATRMTFFIATMTIAGFPLLSAFFSKDTILHEAFVLPFAFGWNKIAGVMGYITALLTAIYMLRLYYRTFEGEYRGPSDVTPRETGPSMTWVLWILAGLSIIAGFLGIPAEGANVMKNFLDPVFSHGTEVALEFRPWHENHLPPLFFMVLSALIFVAGWWTARYIYLLKPGLSEAMKVKYQRVYRILWEKYRVDEAYQAIFIRPGHWLCGVLWRNFDEDVIDDGLVEGTGRAVDWIGTSLRPLQNGYLRTYALYIVLGIVILVLLAGM